MFGPGRTDDQVCVVLGAFLRLDHIGELIERHAHLSGHGDKHVGRDNACSMEPP